jgi:hypothetical protein
LRNVRTHSRVANSSRWFYDKFADKYDSLISDERYDELMPFFLGVFRSTT